LERGEYWPEAAALFESPFMNCNEFTAHRQAIESCRRMKAITAVMTGNLTDNDLNGLTSSVRSEALALRKILNNQGRESALQQLSNLPHLKSGWALSRLIRYAMYAERSDLAADWSAKLIAEDPKNTNFRLLAAASHALSGRTEQARKLFESLKKVSQELDEEAPFNKSMIEILRSSGLINEDSIRQAFAGWRPIHSSRPLHDNLGPVLWQPIKIPNLQWTDSDGTERSLDSLVPGKPAVIALVLGNCPRCDTQFALLEEKRAELNAKGIELIAIASTPVNLPVFKQMWSFDEFESIPIHGLFVVNSDREVVWQDVSAEAFLDIDFLMNELPRVLSPIQRSMIRGSISK
jgi:tetratricopeptide (TPR) repeat protein